ncbi:5' nucleotidase, NT5C type [Viridibacillus arvi]|uniref:5' nucleotidase, NT5C type n=1 Tax=Viridibacillus arvi TaxID=263475 RepID=UPI003D0188F7
MKKNYRFGIDIDGTVTTPESLLPHINKAFNVNLALSDIKQYDLTAAFPVDSDEFFKWFRENEPEIYMASPIQQDAQAILSAWQKDVELYYITAREDNSTDVTYEWFKQFNVPYDKIDIVGPVNKAIKAREYDVHAFFEDKHANAVQLHEELDIPVLLFDAPYNREPIPNGVIRVSNWQEANHWIKKEFGI